jgi:hypothetical protein
MAFVSKPIGMAAVAGIVLVSVGGYVWVV